MLKDTSSSPSHGDIIIAEEATATAEEATATAERPAAIVERPLPSMKDHCRRSQIGLVADGSLSLLQWFLLLPYCLHFGRRNH
jgi:hypothetical protein